MSRPCISLNTLNIQTQTLKLLRLSADLSDEDLTAVMVSCLLRLIRLCGHESLSRHTHSNSTLLPSHTWNSCASADRVCRDLEISAGVYSNEALICGHGPKTGSGV